LVDQEWTGFTELTRFIITLLLYYQARRFKFHLQRVFVDLFQKAREAIHALTATQLGGLPIGLVVRRLNQFLIGWSNYFARG